MHEEEFATLVEEICSSDDRYRAGAYVFLNEAVAFTVAKLHRERLRGEERHVSGQELIAGVAECAVKQFGFLAWDVLCDWKMTTGPAVGDVVYNMYAKGLLSLGKHDSREDFCAVGSLKELVESFQPRAEVFESERITSLDL